MARYDVQDSYGYETDNTYIPALINPPTIFAVPPLLVNGNNELWMAVTCPDALYGGCTVFASLDDSTYKPIGKLYRQSRQGWLTDSLPAGTSPDITNTLSVTMHAFTNAIESVSNVAVNTAQSLCYVGGELLAYRDATLTNLINGKSSYNLSYLRRGLYDSPQGAVTNAPFVFIDNVLFKYSYTSELAENVVYLKFQGFNVTESGLQQMSDLVAYPFMIPPFVSAGGGGGIAPGTFNEDKVIVGSSLDGVKESLVTIADDVISGYREKHITISATAFTITSFVTSGSVLRFTAATDVTVTISNTLPVGWCCSIRQIGTGRVQFVASSGAVLKNRQNFTKSAGKDAWIALACDSNNFGVAANVFIGGDLAL
ncbi:hypothetical protein [Crenothrix polyspora]|uniref:Rcc01698-like C-terminal domain-containing protein n=1 Tax=Crenothrix polyspora TaxID=360316 RepID=A0A1R4HIJ1_9GAMM|nr:hypothetical protein [Crenothrix polyspora]SJM96009.1 hypothetical protein CRENPOLYSF1_830008 [Crenothrix polyspora]